MHSTAVGGYHSYNVLLGVRKFYTAYIKIVSHVLSDRHSEMRSLGGTLVGLGIHCRDGGVRTLRVGGLRVTGCCRRCASCPLR